MTLTAAPGAACTTSSTRLGWPALRPLQEAAVEPLLAGEDALLLAPTAGGKTEAAMFPLLSAMAARAAGPALSVLYVCPLKALLNNLLPRLERYAGWLGPPGRALARRRHRRRRGSASCATRPTSC